MGCSTNWRHVNFDETRGLEVDLLAPAPSGRLWMIECKATHTPRPAMAAPILALYRAMDGEHTQAAVVHRKAKSGPETSALAPDVRAMGLGTFVNAFTSARIPKGPAKRV
jgi:hypothetical protein